MPFLCTSACNIASADACVVTQELRISCSMPSVQTLLRGTCRMSLKTLHCAAVAAATIITEHKKKHYWKCWMASFLERWNQNLNLLGEVRMNSYALFRNFTRMTASDLSYCCNIGPSIKKQDNNMREAIPISRHLAITLRFLATGDMYHTLMYIFRISVPAILTSIPEVCQAVIKSLKGYVEVSKKTFHRYDVNINKCK